MVNASYTAYPPSPAGDATMAKISVIFYDGAPKVGDDMQAWGMYDIITNTINIADQGDFLKTYPQKP